MLEDYSRRCKAIESEQHYNQPKDCVNDLDREFHGREKKWEEADVTGDRQWPEDAKIASICECKEAERNNDE